ncbi:MAG: ATP-dependent DNA helicase RecG [Acidimicrobiales bacterium]
MTEGPIGRKLGQLERLSVGVLKGVGTRKRSALKLMGIETVLDLLTHYPRRYADRTRAVAISDLVAGDEGVVSAIVKRASLKRLRNRRSLVEVVVDDGSGVLDVTFFNQQWRVKQLAEGTEVALFGRVGVFRNTLQMANPVVEVVGSRSSRQTGRLVPIYPQSERAGISSIELATFIEEALERAGEFADPLEYGIQASLGLVTRTEAFRNVHQPGSEEDWQNARRRLAFDELLRIQLALVMRRRAAAADARGIAHDVESEAVLVDSFVGALPFALTAAQRRVIGEIRADLALKEPMHRLLQGDVGSGKTVVALAALLFGVQGGYQGAFMVPTEVLAEQHFFAARSLLGDLKVEDQSVVGGERPVAAALVTAKTSDRARSGIVRDLEAGLVDIVVGTHALITEDVQFRSLGVVVIDEQHRFGVDQRAALREKGSVHEEASHDPDLLVMTATPIPRTAAMTVYGDLDASVLDEMPPGRSPIETRWIRDENEHVAWERVRHDVAAGHQAYVVCPLVSPGTDEVDDDGWWEMTEEEIEAAFGEGRLFPEREGDVTPRRPARSVTAEADRLSRGELRGLRVEVLHGQLPARRKEEVMTAFRSHEIDVLVATTVIEVGVDVPDATVIVIEDADRFGIAQLHQLRGRVGRGSDPSVCFLVTGDVSEDAEKRLLALVASNDGFELAEVDLELRGEGTLLGARQKGRSDLRLASLRDHRDLVEPAREVAARMIDLDPTLSNDPLLADELRIFVGEEEAAYLLRA